jgi:hypothetical protein
MTKAEIRDIAERAAWTAGEAFLAVFAVTGVWAADLSTARQGAIAGVAAALSVVKTFVQTKVRKLDTRTAPAA